MKKLLLFFSLSLCAFAQSPTKVAPDCIIQASFAGSGQSTPTSTTCGDNRQNTITNWVFAYYVDGFSGISVVVQGAPDASGVPGSWATLGGTVSTAGCGANPCTVATQSFIVLNGYAPWVRVSLTSVTGSGTLVGQLLGYKSPGAVTGGGGGSGCPNPCPVTQSTVPWQEAPYGLSTFNTGQQAVTASAVNLGTNTARYVCVKALIGNTINIYVGPSGVTDSTGFELTPGQTGCWQVANTNLLYVIASTTGASVAWALID